MRMHYHHKDHNDLWALRRRSHLFIGLALSLCFAGCAHRAKPVAQQPPAPKNQTTSTSPTAQPPAPPALPGISAPPAVPTVPAEAAASAGVAEPTVVGPQSEASQTSTGNLAVTWSQQGIASWYGPRFHGRLTASGERFNTNALTAAHKTLPFGSRVRVRSLSDGKEVVVRINDRGPFIKGRIIDLSQAAARALGFVGVKQVVIERLQ
jgi:rare lipoprotein A